MTATREQLLARWETTEGQQLAERVCRALDPLRAGRKAPWQGRNAGVQQLDALLVGQIAQLPFADEVSPQIDLRGLHLPGEDEHINLKYTNLSNVRLDYAYRISKIIGCEVRGAVLDGAISINGSFSREALSGISLVGAAFRGGSFNACDLTEANLRGASLVLVKMSKARCVDADISGVDLRFADLHDTDLSGTDLRETTLTEANLADVIFNNGTRLQGADLRGALLSPDFRAFAQQSGAQLSKEQTFWAKTLAEYDAVIRVLQKENTDGSQDEAIRLMTSIRNKLANDPEGFSFEEAVKQAGNPPWIEHVYEIWGEVSRRLVYYI
jgi:uncharacterized protein YjbI with pentapeptide repeats